MTPKSVYLFIYIVLCVAWLIWKWRAMRSHAHAVVPKPRERQKLRPRTPKSCADCQHEPILAVPEQRQVTPWRELKSRRGRKKQIDTEGYACWNEQCAYYGVTDAQVHALVGYGHHGKGDRIQDLFCQACHTKVSERRGTALYRLKTPAAQVSQVLAMLAEGLDVSAAERVSGHAQATIRCWLAGAGIHSERLHQHLFQGLELTHIQVAKVRSLCATAPVAAHCI